MEHELAVWHISCLVAQHQVTKKIKNRLPISQIAPKAPVELTDDPLPWIYMSVVQEIQGHEISFVPQMINRSKLITHWSSDDILTIRISRYHTDPVNMDSIINEASWSVKKHRRRNQNRTSKEALRLGQKITCGLFCSAALKMTYLVSFCLQFLPNWEKSVTF